MIECRTLRHPPSVLKEYGGIKARRVSLYKPFCNCIKSYAPYDCRRSSTWRKQSLILFGSMRPYFHKVGLGRVNSEQDMK